MTKQDNYGPHKIFDIVSKLTPAQAAATLTQLSGEKWTPAEAESSMAHWRELSKGK